MFQVGLLLMNSQKARITLTSEKTQSLHPPAENSEKRRAQRCEYASSFQVLHKQEPAQYCDSDLRQTRRGVVVLKVLLRALFCFCDVKCDLLMCVLRFLCS